MRMDDVVCAGKLKTTAIPLFFWLTVLYVFLLCNASALKIGRIVPSVAFSGQEIYIETDSNDKSEISKIRIGEEYLQSNQLTFVNGQKIWIVLKLPLNMQTGEYLIELNPNDSLNIVDINSLSKINILGSPKSAFVFSKKLINSVNLDNLPPDLPIGLKNEIINASKRLETINFDKIRQLTGATSYCSSVLSAASVGSYFDISLAGQYLKDPLVPVPTDGMRPPGGGISTLGFASPAILSGQNQDNFNQIELEKLKQSTISKKIKIYVMDTYDGKKDDYKYKSSDQSGVALMGHGMWIGEIIKSIAPGSSISFINVCGDIYCNPIELYNALCKIQADRHSIVNLSLATRFNDPVLRGIISELAAKGVLFVASYGNSESCLAKTGNIKKMIQDCFLYPSDWMYSNKDSKIYKYGIEGVFSVGANTRVPPTLSNPDPQPEESNFNRGNPYSEVVDGNKITYLGARGDYMRIKISAPGAFKFQGATYAGTSFAAPVLTAMLAHRLSACPSGKINYNSSTASGAGLVIEGPITSTLILSKCK